MATNAAGPRLASIAELVKDILLHIPLNEILRAQGVNKTWRDFIKDSPQLQKALFFKPCTDYQLELVRNDSGDDENQEYLIKSCPNDYECRYDEDKGAFEERYLWPLGWKADELRYSEHGPVLNPFIWTHLPWLNDHSADKLRTAPSSSKYSEASWRKMLCTQPPIGDAVVDFEAYTLHYHVAFPGPSEIGVTLGRLQEVADAFYGFAEFQEELMFRDVMKENRTTRSECTAARILASISPVKEVAQPDSRMAMLVVPRGSS